MRRSSFVKMAIAAFTAILLTFLVRGSTRLVIGDEYAMLLSLPIGVIASMLVVATVVAAVLDLTGVKPMDDDLGE